MHLWKNWFVKKCSISASFSHLCVFLVLGVNDCFQHLLSCFFFFFLVKRFREPKHERRPWRIWYASACFRLKFFYYWRTDCLHMKLKNMMARNWWLIVRSNKKITKIRDSTKNCSVHFSASACLLYISGNLYTDVQLGTRLQAALPPEDENIQLSSEHLKSI